MTEYRNPTLRRQGPNEKLVLYPHTKCRGPKNLLNFQGSTGAELKVERTYCEFSGLLEEGPQDGGKGFVNL